MMIIMHFHIYCDKVIPSCDNMRIKQYKGSYYWKFLDYNDFIL